jgi:hypothetical protein
MLPDTVALPIMDRLLGCLMVELERSPAGTPEFSGLLPGAAVITDYCGMAWVRLQQAAPSARFPNAGATPSSCADPTAVTVQLGVTRCIPTSEATGQPPTPAQQDLAVRGQMGDYAALRRAVLCCLKGEVYVLGAYLPLGPQGGIGGGALTVTVQVV